MTDPLPPNFFVVGGTLKREAPSYISRPADGELFRLTLEGEYCNVLASRQMGKSSLMVRTAERLRRHGVRSVIVDLTRIGSSITASQWYLSFIAEMAWQLDLDLDVDAWWLDREERGPVHNFSSFLRDVVFREISDPIVVFVDEIDSTLNLEFTDDFFAAIRAAYNARANDERYERLTFVLLGVARPADLVKDRTRTPYNIGNNTDLTDFRIQELGVFQDVLEVTHPEQGEQILQWVLDWTGGQPYLTQKLCETLIERKNGVLVKKEIDSCVTQLFLGEKARKESNLMAIRDRVKSSPYLVEMLKIYQQVLRNKRIPDEERSLEKNELKLTGLVQVSPTGMLAVRNQIYAHVFDKAWVKANIPVPISQRIAAIASIIAALAALVAGYLYFQQQNQPTATDIQAEAYIEQFKTSESTDVRLTSLARLFGLGDEYLQQGRTLFFDLDVIGQETLFTELSSLEEMDWALIDVITHTYQYLDNNTEGNAVLEAMARALKKSTAVGAPSLVSEIEFWLLGRDFDAVGSTEFAVRMYGRAWNESESRGSPNAGIHFDWATLLANEGDFESSLDHLEAMLELDDAFQIHAIETFDKYPDLFAVWVETKGNYPVLTRILPTATPKPVSNIDSGNPPDSSPETPVIGGADEIAFVMGGDIWIVNVDGKDLQQLTIDSGEKRNVQWAPDGRAVHYTLHNCIFTVTLDAHSETVTCFEDIEFIEFFEISPNGQKIAIVVEQTLYIVYYDLEALKQITIVDDLKMVAPCENLAPYEQSPIKQVHFSNDNREIAVLAIIDTPNASQAWGETVSLNSGAFYYPSVSTIEIIQVLDISDCTSHIPILNEFPSEQFMLEGYAQNPSIPGFDWDGETLFSLNTSLDSDDFGDLYVFDTETNTGQMINPIEGKCCYRGSRWSPDSRFLLFAFQDFSPGTERAIDFYYIPFGAIAITARFEPLLLLSLDPSEFSYPALRPETVP